MEDFCIEGTHTVTSLNGESLMQQQDSICVGAMHVVAAKCPEPAAQLTEMCQAHSDFTALSHTQLNSLLETSEGVA